jgi:cell wall-associated NlpC family hydrolase
MTRVIPPLTDAEREAFVSAARACVGVRWQHQGRTLHGLDCGGLVVSALRANGRTPHDPTGYPRRPYLHSLEATVQRNFGKPMPADTELRDGDVVVMQCNESAPNHVGIIGTHRDMLTLIHAYAGDRAVVEMRLDDVWRNRIVEVYR